MLPKYPSLKTKMFIYEICSYGNFQIRAHMGSPDWAYDRLPTFAEITSDLRSVADDSNKWESERVLALLLEGAYRGTLITNSEDIYSHRVRIEIAPNFNDRWEEV